MTKGTGMSEVLNPIFVSVFSSKTSQRSGAREDVLLLLGGEESG